MYLVKPIVMMSIGSLVLVVGIVLTVFHFLFEGDPVKDEKNPPYFTFGPVVCFRNSDCNICFGLVFYQKREVVVGQCSSYNCSRHGRYSHSLYSHGDRGSTS